MKVQSFAKKQAGFTLIELVVVIVILGILAAVAIPRFTNMSVQARTASVNGMLGAVQSATAISHAQALVGNVVNGNIAMDGATVVMAFSYPSGAVSDGLNPPTGGIPVALSAMDGFTYTPGAAGAAGHFALNGAPVAAADAATSTPATQCGVNYTPAPNANTPPVIAAVFTGC